MHQLSDVYGETDASVTAMALPSSIYSIKFWILSLEKLCDWGLLLTQANGDSGGMVIPNLGCEGFILSTISWIESLDVFETLLIKK